MGELAHHHPQELQLDIPGDQEAKEENSSHPSSTITNNQATLTPTTKNLWWWLRVALYSLLVLSSQSAATLLGRLYYNKGGNSKWLATLIQLVGFPILLLLYFIPTSKHPNNTNYPHIQTDPEAQSQSQSPSLKILALVYLSLGTIAALNCYFYSVGLMYLPVSTYSLICSSQLAFNALFSFFLNAQKFTPYITNSLVLLTIASTLLVFQSNSEDPKGVSKGKYAIGFVCTIGASAGYGLVLSLTQLCFRRVIRKETFRAVLDMIVYPSSVSSVIIMVGFFVSGEWAHLGREMDRYELGKASYVMNLVGTAIAWQAFMISAVGLIFDVSSLFSNSISAVGLPIVPILAVVFFGERMDGIKVIAMILAVWGFISYVYQHYLDDAKLKAQRKSVGGDEASVRSPLNTPIARVGG
ncbi:purine permease 21-like [Rhodamnia argentea]|uniref:Probable purine permease n=1 Tax=Rhodamnia argentea TaxID=178133 RepID=A0A8B8N5M1_9MYRT|nr:purine permease 21-like [Rhodamnia argentea]